MSVIINGDTGIDKITDGSVVNADIASGIDAAKLTGTLPALDASSLTGIPAPAALSTASGSAPSYSARAWVLFDGGASPTVNGSGNISSVVQVSSGVYGITLANAMPDINYVISNCGWTGNQNMIAQENDPGVHRTTTYFEVVYEAVGGSKLNNTYNSVMVLR